MNWFRNLFKKKESLRDKCIAAYGEEFGKKYDSVNSGEPIGGFEDTVRFIEMVEAVKQNKPYNLSDESMIKIVDVFIPGQNGEPDINIKFND